jgi:ubiquitin-like 1-activating enzyme E1 B
MGSEEFPRRVFEKVFKEDIERLRSMEDMWKTRRPPQALDFDVLTKEALGRGEKIAQKDQVVWTAAENFAVFVDSLRRLSNRMEETRANADIGNAPATLTFDKDDVDTLDFVAASANLRSIIFGIETRSKFDIKRKLLILRLFLHTANFYRNGRQYHPRNRDHKRHDSLLMRVTSIQSLA